MERINREGEHGSTPSRSDRFFRVEHEWYFTTREGQTHGPFDSKEEADASLTLFLSHVPKYGR
jgi:hypothetical protein